ncbi:unnamed protein product [Chironomus riparius]|uniref:Uncharacterized protein n=1 Tax=Chironomus riparius TaxID=315576 RepID=A0A9N9WSH8_9DIPT|nr:unnamed protein product [Chironomus riparius]
MFKLKVFFLISVISCTLSSPISSILSLYEELDDDNYDIIVDQRQNGTQNFRIKVNGVNIAIPIDEHQDSQFSELEIASLLGIPSSTQIPISIGNDDKNDFSEFASLFDFKKTSKTGHKKELIDTQSRTKDIPTNGQIMGDTKDSVKTLVKNSGKKYKVLVGEKYIIPIIQYLKKHIENVE